MRTLFLITARGGSKGIPRKNVRQLGGVPLLGFKAIAAQRSGVCARLVLSSEDPEIQQVARDFGVDVPFTRPPELATDTASSADVIEHAMKWFEERSETYDAVMLLEPSSPFARAEDFRAAVAMMERTGAQAVVGMRKMEVASIYVGEIDASGRISSIIDKMNQRTNVARQQSPQEYTMNGGLYLFRWDYFRRTRNIYADRDGVYGLVMPDEYSLELDEMEDWHFAEFLVERGIVDMSNWRP
ncbi:MAG: acylneuraminate cytidylyltransferase family protein [Deltaproteobacteria bacterium]|nr:acylneuraminate cytidylyltransferase family protein [Deltaproteobacteria bacterium]